MLAENVCVHAAAGNGAYGRLHGMPAPDATWNQGESQMRIAAKGVVRNSVANWHTVV